MMITDIIYELRQSGLNLEQSKLVDQLEKIEKGTIVWTAEDFLHMNEDERNHIDNLEITPENAQLALEDMVAHHDASVGIGWDILYDYYLNYATPRTETII